MSRPESDDEEVSEELKEDLEERAEEVLEDGEYVTFEEHNGQRD